MNSSVCKMLLRRPALSTVTSFWRTLCSASSGKPILTLYTKDPCQLCEEAKIQLEPLKDQFVLEEVDITLPENEHWFGLYRYEIPVFYFEKKFLCKNRIDLEKLREKLAHWQHEGNKEPAK